MVSDSKPQFQLIYHDGSLVPLTPDKVITTITKAFIAVEGKVAHDIVVRLTDAVFNAFKRRFPNGGTLHVENVQDQVELALMREGYYDVAKVYVFSDERTCSIDDTECEACQ